MKLLVSSALVVEHVELLAEYIKEYFLEADLIRLGVQDSWKLGGGDRVPILMNKWTDFQVHFINGWESFTSDHSNSFWEENRPAFHAYDYGTNLELETVSNIATLLRETRPRRNNDSPVSNQNDEDSFLSSDSLSDSSEDNLDGVEEIDYEPFYSNSRPSTSQTGDQGPLNASASQVGDQGPSNASASQTGHQRLSNASASQGDNEGLPANGLASAMPI